MCKWLEKVHESQASDEDVRSDYFDKWTEPTDSKETHFIHLKRSKIELQVRVDILSFQSTTFELLVVTKELAGSLMAVNGHVFVLSVQSPK